MQVAMQERPSRRLATSAGIINAVAKGPSTMKKINEVKWT